MLLFPDPRPLVERLGAAFFREAPVGAGVYVMRDAGGRAAIRRQGQEFAPAVVQLSGGQSRTDASPASAAVARGRAHRVD